MASHPLRAHLLALLLPLATLAILLAGSELFRAYAWFLFLAALTISTGVIAALVLHAIRSREQLRQVKSERRIFAALIENSSDFIGIADPSGRPVYGNPAARRMVALPPQTRIEDTRILDYYPAEQRAFVEDVILKAMVQDGHWKGETYFRNWQTGEAIPVSDTHFMIRDPDGGAVLGMGTITRDITDLRRAREDVESAHKRLLSLFDSAPEGIFIADLDGRYTDVNAAGCRIVGYARDDLIGKTIHDLIDADDAVRLEQDKQQLLAGQEVVGEWMLRRRDGSKVPAEVCAKILPDGRWQGFVRDITARKRLENELAAKSADLERAQSVAQIGSWRLDVQRNELRWSAEAYRIFGVESGTAMTYEGFLACVHPEDRDEVDRRWTAALGGARYDIEHRLLVAGQVKWVREKADLEFDEHGALLGGIGITQDITERKQLEDAIRLAHETTSGILSISTDAIISIDEDQRITMFNEGAENTFGYTKAEAIGAPLEMLLPERSRSIHRQHIERFAAGPNIAMQMAARHAELLGLRKNGDEFPAEAAISKLEVGGHKVLTVTVRDVTEQRRIEHEQRFLAEAGPILASSLDYERTLDQVAQLAVREIADLCIVDVVSVEGEVRRLKATCRDPAMAAIADGLMRISLDPTRPYLTKTALTTHEPMLLERVTDEVVASFAQSEEHLELLRALDPTSFLAVPLIARGRLVGAIALASSGSSRRLGTAELGLAQELARRAALAIESARLYAIAQRAIQARDDVLGVVAHDLRNPLNAVLLQADMLADRKAGDMLKRSATRMNRLIQDILDVTRLEAGQLTVHRERLSTVQLLLDVVETQRPLAEAARLALLLDVSPDLPDVFGDHDRLLQICENLISNAIKFTMHGTVTIGAAARDRDVMFWVQDTGCGIASEALQHVFDRFWKSDTDVRRGAGLGLAIVKGLVEAHGGHAWVESTQGAGTCFYFTIPQAAPIGTRESTSPVHA